MRATKPSGIEWAEEIPMEWQVKPLFAIGSESRVSNSGGKHDNLLSLSFGEVVEKDINSRDGLLPESFDTYQVIKPNDLVFRFTDLQNDKRSLRSALSKHSGIITSAYMAFTPRDCEPRFLAYLMRSYDLTKVFYAMGSGLRQSLKFGDVKRLPIILPPIDEQKAIAEFLDRETAQIDNLIAKQEQLIATLGERRQALIARVVGRGLDAHAAYSSEPLSALGECPEHWEVKRIKYSVETSKNGAWGDEESGTDTDIWCVRIADFDRENRRVNQTPRTIRSVPVSERTGRVLKRGDLVIEKSGGGDQAPVGCVVSFDFDEAAVCSNFAARITLKTNQDSRFWVYAHAALYGQRITWRSIKQTSGIQNLDFSSYLNEPIGFPPIDEQQEIANYLDEHTAKLDAVVGKSSEVIATLKERRQALISAAVTGKIPVGA